jgi:hypothetical protein
MVADTKEVADKAGVAVIKVAAVKEEMAAAVATKAAAVSGAMAAAAIVRIEIHKGTNQTMHFANRKAGGTQNHENNN